MDLRARPLLSPMLFLVQIIHLKNCCTLGNKIPKDSVQLHDSVCYTFFLFLHKFFYCYAFPDHSPFLDFATIPTITTHPYFFDSISCFTFKRLYRLEHFLEARRPRERNPLWRSARIVEVSMGKKKQLTLLL